MRKLLLIHAFAGLAILGCGKKPDPVPSPFGATDPVPAPAGTVVSDLTRMAGTWGVESIDTRGGELVKQILDTIVFEVEGSVVTVIEAYKKESRHAAITLNETPKPKEVDLHRSDRAGKPRGTGPFDLCRGIYRFDGDKLVLALPFGDIPRPTEFKTYAANESSGVFVVTMVKLSAEDVARRRTAVSLAQIQNARETMRMIEMACKAYMIKNGGMPPGSLAQLAHPAFGKPLLESEDSLVDPWGRKYEYVIETNDYGDPKPTLFTLHPLTKKPIYGDEKR